MLILFIIALTILSFSAYACGYYAGQQATHARYAQHPSTRPLDPSRHAANVAFYNKRGSTR